MNQFINIYADSQCAAAYAHLECSGTYYLAYRDLPEILSKYIIGKRALDFGCGAGRSTRFLKEIGFETTGIDISESMLKHAKAKDPQGDYYLLTEEMEEVDIKKLGNQSYDVILAAFPFDNVPTLEKKVSLLKALSHLLNSDGKIINIVSSPVLYTHEWSSFTTKDFLENSHAKSGDAVNITLLNTEDQNPIKDILWTNEDIFWTHEAYQDVYKQAGLELIETYRPLGKDNEPYQWVNETTIAPWAIYVLKKLSSH